MTEQEWLTSEDPAAMLRRFDADSPHPRRKPPSDRKLHLFADACRQLGYCVHRYDDPAEDAGHMAGCVMHEDNLRHAPAVAALLRDVAGNPFRRVCLCGAGAPQADCPRAARLRTPDVLRLAAACAECLPGGTLDPARLGILADALEEAGCVAQGCIHCGGGAYVNLNPPCSCASSEILLHLRFRGPHVCGCWAIDRILGRE